MSKTEAERFRDQSTEARLQAENAISPLDKEAWLRIAEEWLKLAVTIEGRQLGETETPKTK
jgi:hypothetical protein